MTQMILATRNNTGEITIRIKLDWEYIHDEQSSSTAEKV